MCDDLDQDEVQVEEDVFIHQGVYDVFAGNAALDSVEQCVLIDRLLSDIRNDVETDMKMCVPSIGELGGKSDIVPLVRRGSVVEKKKKKGGHFFHRSQL